MRQFSCFRFLSVWKSKKYANCEPTTIWVRFAWRFARVCDNFTAAVVSELQRGPHIVL